jgi:hypothetical protein
MIQLFIEELKNLNFHRKFFSTSLYEKVAKYLAEISKKGTIMLITIKNNGTNGHSNYCYYIISFFLEEFLLEILKITSCLISLIIHTCHPLSTSAHLSFPIPLFLSMIFLFAFFKVT